jgi:site-specific recombinase XerD
VLAQDMKKGLEVLTLNEPTFQSLLQNFFLKRLLQQRNVSQNTISSYRDTFRLFFEFMKSKYRINPSDISIEQMNLEYIEDFCNCLTEERSCSSSTVNNRLSAIKSFLKYVIEQHPEFSNIVKGTLSLPFRKQEKKAMCFITREEFDVYLSLCDTSTPIGSRDKLMLLLLYNTGVRVSELLAIKYSDIRDLNTPGNSSVKICGKGRKERVVPIWRSTAKYIRKYANTFNISGDDKMFINKNGAPMTRSGIYGRVEKLTNLSSAVIPSLK